MFNTITQPEKIIPEHLRHNGKGWNRYHMAGKSRRILKLVGVGHGIVDSIDLSHINNKFKLSDDTKNKILMCILDGKTIEIEFRTRIEHLVKYQILDYLRYLRLETKEDRIGFKLYGKTKLYPSKILIYNKNNYVKKSKFNKQITNIKQEFIAFRVSQVDYELYKQAANNLNMNISDWIRNCIKQGLSKCK